jgi:RHS repeat-associated protein
MAKDTTANATYTPQFFMPDVYSVQNYYAFGQSMPNWSSTAAVNDPKKYRFGYNGKEDDDEWGKQDYGARIYDGRIGRWLSLDPLAQKYAYLSPYNFVANSPLLNTDPDGREIIVKLIDKDDKSKITILKFKEGKFYNENKEEYNTQNCLFLEDFVAAYEYLSKVPDAKAVIDAVANDETRQVEIFKSTHMLSVWGNDKEIGWNPISGLFFEKGKKDQTPALGLLHELGHTFLKWFKPEMKENEDKWIIENLEHKVASVKDQEGTRSEHGDGYPTPTKEPTTTETETKESKNNRKEREKKETVKVQVKNQ